MKFVCYTFYLLFLFLLFSISFSSLLTAGEESFIVLPVLNTDPVQVSQEQKEIAENLYRQVVVAAENKQGLEAMRLAVQVIEANPEHEIVRRIFGFKLFHGQWRTDWEMNRLKKGFIDHPVFGWLPKEFVEPYESGKRMIPKLGWVSADEDNKFHADIRNGWQIATEHYDLLTNHSLEEGVQMSRKLEHLYKAWKMLFFNMLFSEEKLAKLFLETLPSVPLPRHRVYVFRDKRDYVFFLKDSEQGFEAQLRESNGFYHPQRFISYFFPVSCNMDEFDADTVRKALYHEGTHQLFQEARPKSNLPGVRNNFWIVEGMAMFMETFRIEGNQYKLGNQEDSRLFAAKAHRFEPEYLFYLPFEQTVALGRREFQTHPRLARLYSQSAGMTHFLMLYRNGKYRYAVFELLRQVYAGAVRPDTLSKLTGHSYQELDQEYTEFLRTIP
ncbi:MAG: hypothetical protein LBC20_15340 [Planctomycetaceae bacterium]|jgi:hypothetical protein|nr:hypothetical protein [Planctomycetaceae bacterium]